MEVPYQPSIAPKTKLVELQATRIADPIDRLRYLRSKATPAAPSRFAKYAKHKPLLQKGLVAVALAVIMVGVITTQRPVKARTLSRSATPIATAPTILTPSNPGKIWLVDTRDTGQELYSNTLRIETRFAIPLGEEPKWKYYRFGAGAKSPAEMKDPVGIVFHTTESMMAPFEEEKNKRLKLLGESAIIFVRSKRAYHYLVDRFGRVWRITQESEPAFHAGASIWADKDSTYINLNHSFLGVSFEAAQSHEDGEPLITDAQKLSARLLTDMLRSKYHISEKNCVTHGQVSVNNDNFGVGYHTDFGGEFPFAEVGLPDNYRIPLPSIHLFGFQYDESYLNAMGPPMDASLAKAAEMLALQAKTLGVTPAILTRKLRDQYGQITQSLKKENKNEVSN